MNMIISPSKRNLKKCCLFFVVENQDHEEEEIAASDVSKEDAESHNSSKEWQEIEDQGRLIFELVRNSWPMIGYFKISNRL